ncbi:alpha/beta-hydrolase [Linnemannia elongata AG-77]|uniref:Alpha/beta-hydrolase n=1 Tax=Linnemannia elongata AG-77 TaxID=1314771 RepID=A0A197JYK8_9FUNG|nr:alpha/beta-hydrolase [Linnemannia elongata AG-77]
MRANTLLLTIAISLLLSSANAAPAPIPIPGTSESLEVIKIDTAQPTPPSDLVHTVEAALGSIADIFLGVSSPKSDQTDWSCQLTDEHPNPVIMLHGLIAPSFTSWRVMAERLSEEGYCVYQLKYGMIPGFETIGGLTDIRESAKELDAFITKVLATTSSPSTQKVDLIGHSEGTVLARYYLKFLDRQGQPQQNVEEDNTDQKTHQERPGRVRSLVSIAPVGKGTSVQGLVSMTQVLGVFDFLKDAVQQYCAACVQLLEGSELMKALYGDDGLQAEVPGVRYLNIVTSRDNMVTPFTNGVMTFPEALESTSVERVGVEAKAPWLQNLVIENHCDFNPEHSNHFGIFQSPFAFHATNAFLSSDSSTLDATIPCTDTSSS